jgi:drug/metabolite transporter (DMT)-like permease
MPRNASRADSHVDPRFALLLTLPPLFWAGNAVAGRLLVGEVSPLLLSLVRWLVALALLLPFGWSALRAHRGTIRRHAGAIVAIGTFGVGAYNTLQYVALQTSTPLNITLIAAATPAFALILGRLFFAARPRPAEWAGAAVSLAGVAWMLARGEPARLATLQLVAGDLWMVAATICWALYSWLLRRHRPVDLPFTAFLCVQMIVGIGVIAPLAAFEAATGNARFVAGPLSIGAIAYMALLPSIAAYYVWDRGVARVGPVLPLYFANLTPLFAALLSLPLLDDVPHLYHAVGLALIMAGIHVANRAAIGAPAKPAGGGRL